MTFDEFRAMSAALQAGQPAVKPCVKLCMAAGCMSCHSDKLRGALEDAKKQSGSDVEIKPVGCLGLCAQGPLVLLEPQHTLFQNVRPEDAMAIINATRGESPGLVRYPDESAFFTRQQKIVLENADRINPEKLEDYLACEGYEALARSIADLKPSEIIQEVVLSGLRGRGGGGFPTGLKWSTVAKASGARKYVICNADEGDPGAFMDRSVLESDPHRVIEGMAIAAYAVGAEHGYIYVRAEYPLAVKRLKEAIRQGEKMGLLGNNIFGSAFSFSVDLRLGAGAFVCGEETALIASIEGKRGTPRPRPPYPAESGLWNCPTLINNVETFANIPPIIRRGGAWYASIGTEKSKGTKVFALAGRIVNTGLIEVPMGMPLREIIYEIGGGIPDGRKFKAVQTGGPSGGCIPAQYLDMPVDYESLGKVGSIMGSGGMIVMDDTSCMVDVAKYFMEFCKSESCGKCVPCRAGTAQLHDLLAKITDGNATLDDLALLEELCDMVKSTSLCGLGQTAPNPVLSTLRHFRDEYLAHIVEKRCPAGVCKLAHAAEVCP